MSDERFTATLSQQEIDIMPYVVSENDEEVFYKLDEVVDLLNELSTSCRQLEGKVKRLNAFIVSKDLAIEYLKWNKKGEC